MKGSKLRWKKSNKKTQFDGGKKRKRKRKRGLGYVAVEAWEATHNCLAEK